MKIIIDNKTNVPDYEVVGIIARMMYEEKDFDGCQFWFKEHRCLVVRLPVSKDHPVDETAFLATETKVKAE